MNAEEWKQYRNERWAKKRQIQPQATQPKATQPKATKIKKGNTAQYVAKKKNFHKKAKQAKSVEKPAPGANVNTITFSPVIYGTVPVTHSFPQPMPQHPWHPQPMPQHLPQPMQQHQPHSFQQHIYDTAPVTHSFQPMYQQHHPHSFQPMFQQHHPHSFQQHQHCDCYLCKN